MKRRYDKDLLKVHFFKIGLNSSAGMAFSVISKISVKEDSFSAVSHVLLNYTSCYLPLQHGFAGAISQTSNLLTLVSPPILKRLIPRLSLLAG